MAWRRPDAAAPGASATGDRTERARPARRHVVYPAILAVVWVAMVAGVDPRGDFPLNDDWAWGQAVRTLYETHTLRIPAFAGMSLVAQVLWGYVACLPFGFSFTALRLSTAVLGLAATLATWGLARAAGATAGLAFLCALAVATNPLVFSHSLTFMTDVPFLAFVLLALLCFVHTARSGSHATAVACVLLTLAATLTRQFGVVLPLLFLLACAVARILPVRTMVVIVCAGLVAHTALRQYEDWLQSSGQMNTNYGVAMKELLGLLHDPRALANRPLSILDALRMVLTYVGLFLLAPVLALLPGRVRTANKVVLLLGVGLAVWFAGSTVASFGPRGWSLPFSPIFVLADLGIGPVNLSDVRVRNLGHFPSAGMVFWERATEVGLAGAGLLIVLVVVTGHELLTRKTTPAGPIAKLTAALALGFVASYGLTVLVIPYDRYFIPLFPVLLIAAAWGAESGAGTWAGRALAVVALFGIVAQAGFSLAATHDYLAWNRVRWEALRDLMDAHGVPPAAIDGGVEFNATYLYGTPSRPGKSPFWVEDDLYMVTFGPVAGYRTFDARPYRRWLPPGEGTIFVLVREPPAE